MRSILIFPVIRIQSNRKFKAGNDRLYTLGLFTYLFIYLFIHFYTLHVLPQIVRHVCMYYSIHINMYNNQYYFNDYEMKIQPKPSISKLQVTDFTYILH